MKLFTFRYCTSHGTLILSMHQSVVNPASLGQESAVFKFFVDSALDALHCGDSFKNPGVDTLQCSDSDSLLILDRCPMLLGQFIDPGKMPCLVGTVYKCPALWVQYVDAMFCKDSL